jgi:hypothetical protein
MRRAYHLSLSVVLIAAVLFLTACGGGGTTNSSNTGTKPATSTSSAPVNSSTTNTAASTSTTIAAGKAVALKFVTQPGGAKAGQPLKTQPKVAIIDGDGVIVVGYIGSVNLRIASGDGEMSGSSNVIFIKGEASFTDISISKAGTFTIKAITREIQVATSDEFIVEP